MTAVSSPGSNTTVLASAGQAALVVHNTLRAAILPFYGHSSGYDAETAEGIQITSQAVNWAAVPEPASVLMIGFGGLLIAGYRRICKMYGRI